MNSGNSKTSDLLRLVFNLADKISLNKCNRYFALSKLTIYYAWKKQKKYKHKNNIFKHQLQNYEINHIMYQTFHIVLSI